MAWLMVHLHRVAEQVNAEGLCDRHLSQHAVHLLGPGNIYVKFIQRTFPVLSAIQNYVGTFLELIWIHVV